jgi:hypothetical protein
VAKRQPMSDALEALFWRDEILQVLFWMRGEGLGDAPSADQLAIFLNTEVVRLRQHLDRMEHEAYLTRAPGGGYALTELGRSQGAHLFMDEFAGLTNQGHGECNNPDCACKTQGPQACESRQPHAHAPSAPPAPPAPVPHDTPAPRKASPARRKSPLRPRTRGRTAKRE